MRRLSSAAVPARRPRALKSAGLVWSGVLAGLLACAAPSQAATPAEPPVATPAATPGAAGPATVESTGPTGAEVLGTLFDAPAAPTVAAPLPAPPPGQAESLPALLARVLASDPQVRVAQSLRQATEQRRLQARSRLGPTLSVSANQGGSQETEFGRPVDRSTNRAEASLRWNLYNGGNDLAELRGATRDVLAAGQDVRRAREDTSERLTEVYVDLLRLQTLLPHAAQRLLAVQRLVDQVRQQNQAGKASDADAAQAAASLLDAEIVHEQLLADHDSARQKLVGLVGGEVRAVLPVALPVDGPVDKPADKPVAKPVDKPVDKPTDGPALAMPAAISPDAQRSASGLIAAAQLRAEAARDRVRPIGSLLAPRIDLELRRQLSDRTLPALTTEQQQVWLISARWDFPLLGETAARRSETQRRAEAAEAEAERVARGALAELQSLGPRIANAERAVAQLDQQIVQFNTLVRAGELQFEAGRRTLAQLITLRESRFNAEQRRVEQAHRLLGARLRLLALTGQLLPALGLGSGVDAGL